MSQQQLDLVTHSKFGSEVPFAEPAWYQGFATPYYTQAHVDFRKKIRDFVETELKPNVTEWEEKEAFPRELYKKVADAGLIEERMKGSGDSFYDLIFNDELARCAAGGLVSSLFVAGIGLPPVQNFGSDYLKQKVVPGVMSGDKVICLCITEPTAGSDVSNIQTDAVKFEKNGKIFYRVNGQKKFITGGAYADFFTVAVKTEGGISLLLLEKEMPGITLRKLKTQGWLTSSTTHILFEDVEVPQENLIGKEGQAFKYIMLNFNKERWSMSIMMTRYARICLEDSISYARVRKTFGKRLIDHQVIRHKIVEMIQRIEATSAMIESVTLQFNQGKQFDLKFFGMIALTKVQATNTMEFCAREASQILGGNAYLRSGPGERIERIYREVRVNAIGGGSAEIMYDLASRVSKL